MKVLIADDEAVSRRTLEAALQSWGYDVVVARDGNEAWEHLLSGGDIAMAILDWMMPGLTGLDVCRRVREEGREPYLYVLLVTARNGIEDIVEGMGAGADDYIAKPFNRLELDVRLRAGRRIVELQAELLTAREQLREQATRDGLTGIWNRSSVLEILEREIARAARSGTAVGVVMVDFDHFKGVNDTHGHLVGDAVLVEATKRMLASIRPYDALGRYGGEEFLLVLPGCDAFKTGNQAERMRQAIGCEPMNLTCGPVVLTASLGATSAETPDCAADQLVKTADEALYLAKHRGRNRVVYLATNP